MALSTEDIAGFADLLRTRAAELEKLSKDAAPARSPVTLDQQAVGRLSRQDALQQQAMANAQEARRSGEQARIEAALKRIDTGEFGYCEACGDEIARRRLEIDPTVRACAPCAGGAVRR